MKLPFLISVPHAGLVVPPEVEDICVLTERQIIEDGDEGASEIYDIADEVVQYVTTSIARAVVDVNRAENDRRADGVVKTHTCWSVPVYSESPSEETVEKLLEAYYRPYHQRLSESGAGIMLGIDCHTMASKAPPIGPDPGSIRPYICLSNADGTCSPEWLQALARSFQKTFGVPVAVNDPFKGGYIVRTHAGEIPWIQLELSRAPFATNAEKRANVLDALGDWLREALS
ncbi:MAG: N-formylglutamate amidohydrolase [Candidatus Latescibacteria bacterium]|nr:N-formylglutamate amidohydrolase [Candidatus Latescibacterota bacterium]NIO56265.1 N-formylglutamate amidohydrolase [Candidatus Latescibacterota bacterium]